MKKLLQVASNGVTYVKSISIHVNVRHQIFFSIKKYLFPTNHNIYDFL